MKYDEKRIIATVLTLAVLWFVLLFAGMGGCTIRPPIVTSPVPGFDGNDQNSGVLKRNADGSYVITAASRDTYNALIEIHGERFLPVLKKDAGLYPGPVIDGLATWIIDAQHLTYFQRMARWRRQGK